MSGTKMVEKFMGKAIDKGQQTLAFQTKKLQNELQINRDAINELIEINNEQTKGILALWKALKMVHSGDSGVFDKVTKELKINMELEK